VRKILLAFLIFGAAFAPAASRPNIVLILTDDQGYGDFGAFYQNSRAPGQATLTTPELDRLTAEGAKLRHHYTSAPVCAPARASLLLGRHQGHSPIRDNQFDKALPDNHTLATVLRQAGYRTACIGKWGLQGSAASNYPGHPLRHGFDEFFGFLPHNAGHTYYHDPSKPLHEDFTEVTPAYTNIYSTDLFTARAKKFIREHLDARPGVPFFLYLSYTAIHNPLHVPGQAYPAGGGLAGGLQWPLAPTAATKDTWIHPAYTNATYDHDGNAGTAEIAWTANMKRYATMLRRMDDGVGDLLQLLRDLRLDTNTLVVFTSDNGPANENGADPRLFDSWGPLDGFKRDCWEGGVRVPTVAWWPGRIPANSHCDFPSGFWDWLPTFAELSGLPAPGNTDGVSLLPSLTGSGAQRDRGYVYIEYFVNASNSASGGVFARKGVTGRDQQQSIRIGNFKGIRTQIASHADPLRLYDVVNDPHEDNNLASDPQHAPLLARMKNLLLTVRRPEASAARPYDSELLPPANPTALTNGFLRYAAYEGDWPWVPDFATLTATATGLVAGLDLGVRPRAEFFGLQFQGQIEAPFDGEYTFYLTSSDGAHLWLHDAQVIDDDFNHNGAEVSAAVRLKAGRHPFRLFYRHRAGAPLLALQYSGPGLAKQPVPVSAFYAPSGDLTAPYAAGDEALTTRGAAVAINALANDGDDGSPSPLTIAGVAAPRSGTAIVSNGVIVYAPAPGFLGEDQFAYHITDGQFFSTGLVRVTVAYRDGLLWFPFNQKSGWRTEESGGGWFGELRGFNDLGACWVAGRWNRALQFDGVDDVVVTLGFPGILGGNSRTVAAWIKTPGFTSSIAIAGWGVRTAGAKWSFIVNNLGQLRQEVESGYAIATTPVNDNAWHHVAVVLDNDGSPNVTETRFYVDGRPDAISGQSARDIATQNGGDMMIGCDNQSRFFLGSIDEFRVYDRALSAAEIAALAGSTSPAKEIWQRRYFGGQPADWSADPDGDGLSCLVEYALGGQPHLPDAKAILPSAAIQNHRLRLSFTRRQAGTHELGYQVQASSNLLNWVALPVSEVEAVAIPDRPGLEQATYQADLPLSQIPRQFLRLLLVE